MKIDVLTIFPRMFDGPLSEGVLRIAQEKGVLEVRVTDIRDFAAGPHRQVDDYPYGGGPGMVMKPEPVFEALYALAGGRTKLKKLGHIILLSPRGRTFSQGQAGRFAQKRQLTLICGRYEGVDERVAGLVDEEVSIGDYVLSGGEFAAMVIMEATARLLPGAVGKAESVEEESFSRGLLEYPQYTRPAEYQGLKVPEVLLSGDHAAIERWRRREALRRTLSLRPDLLEKTELDEIDQKTLSELRGKA